MATSLTLTAIAKIDGMRLHSDAAGPDSSDVAIPPA